MNGCNLTHNFQSQEDVSFRGTECIYIRSIERAICWAQTTLNLGLLENAQKCSETYCFALCAECNTGFKSNFEYKFQTFSRLFPNFFYRLNFSEWPTQVKYRHYNIWHNISKIISTLNKILWQYMSNQKMRSAKLFSFSILRDQKIVFQTFPCWKMTKFFHNFPRLRRKPGNTIAATCNPDSFTSLQQIFVYA